MKLLTISYWGFPDTHNQEGNKEMTTKVIVDNHAGFHIAVDHIENGHLVRTDRSNHSQPHYDTIIHSGKYIVVREEHDGAKQPMSFGMAIDELKRGNKVARSGWNVKGMWLILVPGSPNIKPVAGTPYSKAGIVNEVTIDAHIDMFTVRGTMQPGWQATQSDMLSEDWEIVE